MLNRAWVVPLKVTDPVGRHNQFAEFWHANGSVPFHFERLQQSLPRISAVGSSVKALVRRDGRKKIVVRADGRIGGARKEPNS